MGKEPSFLIRLQSLECNGISFKSYLKLLKVLNKANQQQQPNNLKRLKLLIAESISEIIHPIKIDFIQELDICFFEKMLFKYPIEELIRMFPKLKRLYIYVSGELEPFEIENQELESLTIRCDYFKNQSEFLEQLRDGKSKLSAITIKLRGNIISYKWIKEDGELISK